MHWVKRHTALILFFLVTTVGFVLSPSIGPAWDEPDNMFSGGVYVNFFTHGFDPSYFTLRTEKASAYGDRIVPNDNNPAHLPPVQNYVGTLFVYGAQLLGIKVTAPVIIIAFHWAAVLFFALIVTMTYRFGLLLGLSFWSSLFAALTVFMYPQLFGHGLSNLKDTAQAAMVITSLYYLVKKDLLIGALVWGLGMATKFNAIYVPIIWGLSGVRGIRGIKQWIAVVCIGLFTAFIVWPFLWFDTGHRVLEVVKYFTTVGQGYRVIWDGTRYIVGAGKSLWWYPLASFLYTTPLLLVALILFGGIILVRQRVKDPVWVILPIWILVPLIRTLSPWSAFYDQMRHFLEIVPACMLLAAVGLEGLGRLGKLGRLGGWVIATVVVGQLIFINVLYFPYSTGYYNVLARDPNVNFDRDIEALSVKEAIDYVHQRYGNVRIYFTIGGHQSRYYLTPGDWYVNTDQGKGDIVIVVNKVSHFRISDYVAQYLSGYTPIHEIRRGEEIFAWIYVTPSLETQ